MEIVQQTTKCWGKRLKGYAKTLELKVDSHAIACLRQRPRDCREEFQINLKWGVRIPGIEMLGLGKNINHQTLQVRLRFQRSSNVIFFLHLWWKLSLNWSSGGRNYVFRNNRVELQLIAMRTFVRVNFRYFFFYFVVFGFNLFVKNPSVERFICINPWFAVRDFIQINSY